MDVFYRSPAVPCEDAPERAFGFLMVAVDSSLGPAQRNPGKLVDTLLCNARLSAGLGGLVAPFCPPAIPDCGGRALDVEAAVTNAGVCP